MASAKFSKIAIMDCETSGLFFNENPVTDGTDEYQTVSWGIVIADTTTLVPIDTFYVEIKWNGTALWNTKAQAVHGLSKEHLEANGIDEETATIEILEFFGKHFGTGVIHCGGHNFASFDLLFMRAMMAKIGIPFKTGNRFVDSNSVGFAAFNTYTSDELFNLMGVVRKDHNALEDALASLTVLRNTRALVAGL